MLLRGQVILFPVSTNDSLLLKVAMGYVSIPVILSYFVSSCYKNGDMDLTDLWENSQTFKTQNGVFEWSIYVLRLRIV